MIILCSNLPNDQDMIKALGRDAFPLPLFTDCCFMGVGDDGSALTIAVERKKIGDLAQCMNDGRLVHQMQTAKENNADVFVLIVEGRYRRNPEDGLLEIPVWRINPRTGKRAEFWDPVKPITQFSRFEQYLFELDWLAGVVVKETENVQGTADTIKAIYDNFQRSPDRHQSLKQFFADRPPTVLLSRPGLVRRVAKELDGVGWVRSGDVAKKFPTVRDMVDADVKDWMSIPGIGKKLAGEIVRSLQVGK